MIFISAEKLLVDISLALSRPTIICMNFAVYTQYDLRWKTFAPVICENPRWVFSHMLSKEFYEFCLLRFWSRWLLNDKTEKSIIARKPLRFLFIPPMQMKMLVNSRQFKSDLNNVFHRSRSDWMPIWIPIRVCSRNTLALFYPINKK